MQSVIQNVPVVPVVLCGGGGTRLWPVSRSASPKQFHAFGGTKSLLQETVERAFAIEGAINTILVTGKETADVAQAQCKGVSQLTPDLIVEPEGRNTAAALTAAAVHALRSTGPDTIIVAMPSDHKISSMSEFSKAMTKAVQAATENWIVTFGVEPTAPETGFGYICPSEEASHVADCKKVSRFEEKPSAAKAVSLIEKDGALWNCGIFIARADQICAQMLRFEPETMRAVEASYNLSTKKGTQFHLSDQFRRSKALPFDKAVMERTCSAAVLPVDFEWSDVGTWSAIANHPDIHSADEAILIDCDNAYVESRSNRLVTGVGLKDLVIVDTPDAVLVADQSRSQQVGELSKLISKQRPELTEQSAKVARPWGTYQSIHSGSQHQVKHIEVAPGGQLSLQYHHKRAEHWIIVSGTATVTVGDKTRDYDANEHIYIPKGETHRLENNTSNPIHLIEVQMGDYLGEDDIVRLDDVYGRTDHPRRNTSSEESTIARAS